MGVIKPRKRMDEGFVTLLSTAVERLSRLERVVGSENLGKSLFSLRRKEDR